MKTIHLLAGALAFLCCDTTEAVSFTSHASASTPGFVIGFGSTTVASTRKRPRGCCSTTPTAAAAWSSRPASAVDVQVAAAGSFTAQSGGRRGWFGASTRVRSRQYSHGKVYSHSQPHAVGELYQGTNYLEYVCRIICFSGGRATSTSIALKQKPTVQTARYVTPYPRSLSLLLCFLCDDMIQLRCREPSHLHPRVLHETRFCTEPRYQYT